MNTPESTTAFMPTGSSAQSMHWPITQGQELRYGCPEPRGGQEASDAFLCAYGIDLKKIGVANRGFLDVENAPMNLQDFTALDFETAQGYRWSICQVGLVRVERGEVVGELSMLIRPPDNCYWDQFTGIHGLCSQDTIDAPSFANAWQQIAPWIESKTVVAHNGSFDFSCLRKTLEYYSMPEPEYRPACTYKIYRKGLAALCNDFAIPLNHHDALSDARACASLYLRHLKAVASLSNPVDNPCRC